MKAKTFYSRAAILLLALLLTALPATPLLAGMIDTQTLVAASSAQFERTELVQRLQSDEVRDALTRMGVNPADAQKRVDRLSDAEVLALNARLEELPAGGSALGVIAAVFIVLVITDALGITDIFGFVRAQR
ncbi:DUF6627 family protein [Thioalkalivibrio sp.]|uniref:DUF6627 family protein n=1 Tax=Thioalkalivibrio sp. TaxID=2093813 RepID=UPI0012D53159|nr:DUF6627 family protein [Thioalkalivibrio sp.]TVP83001.1 MAG: hypothetical protein EA346_01365 [Thioalkalivibrio sp.]